MNKEIVKKFIDEIDEIMDELDEIIENNEGDELQKEVSRNANKMRERPSD